MMNRNLKAAVPIRTILLASVTLLMLTYFMVGWLGGYQAVNNETTNATLAKQYKAITGNTTNPGGSLFGTFGNTSTQASGTASNLKNPSGIFSITGAIGSAAQFFGSIPVVFNAFFTFMAGPLIAAGIPVGYAVMLMETMIVLVVVLAILSAIFLFPI